MVSRVVLCLALALAFTEAIAKGCPHPPFLGAGVLVYTKESENTRALLLAHVRGKDCWSSLGGGPKLVQSLSKPVARCEVPSETAIREAEEESRRVLTRQWLEVKVGAAPWFRSKSGFVTYKIRADQKFELSEFQTNYVLTYPDFDETSQLKWITLEFWRERGQVKFKSDLPLSARLCSEFSEGFIEHIQGAQELFE